MFSSTKAQTAKPYSPFFAVFLPTFLTLLSMGFFLRTGWIIASSGLVTTYALILLAVAISLITILSISSMSTNIKMEGGGLYFLLSRTFGIEVGSAITFPLFLAQALSACFYILGCSEILHILFPSLSIALIAPWLFLVVTLISLLSSTFIFKAQFVLFLCVCATLLSFFFGAPLEKSLEVPPIPRVPFWTLFAIFFPCVTGIEGGLSFVHRLKNPSRGIPFGLLSAITCALCIYLTTAYLLDLKSPLDVLATNPLIFEQLSLFPLITIIGIFASSFSAAIASIFSAAGTLQAFAQDKILAKFFGYTHRSLPIISILTTIAVAFGGLFLGSLNAIAPILSVFFLISYGMLNTATTLEALIENPSWRPSLKLPWTLSCLGALLCFVSMLMINPGMSLIGTFFIIILHFLMKKRHLRSGWEDMRYSILLFFSRYAIYKLGLLQPSARTWRPHLLVFIGDPLLRAHLTQLTSALTHKKGFLVFSSITENPAHEEKKLSLFLKKMDIPALILAKSAPNLLAGITSLIDHVGIGPLQLNTIVLGASAKEEKIPLFSQIINFVNLSHKNLLLIRENGLTHRLEKKQRLHQKKRIDIWWGGKSKQNSELMIVLAYMLQTSAEWEGSVVTLKTVITLEEDHLLMQEQLSTFLKGSRLHLNTEIILHTSGDIFQDTIGKASADADLVFLGLKMPEHAESQETYGQYYKTLLIKTEGFPPIAYVLAAESLDFSRILI